jgi:SAM-dependent methyltransferase
MHQGNREWLEHCQRTYGSRWARGGILELGSQDVNGSAREYLTSDLYIGVDFVKGKGVDVACDGHETKFDYTFECLLCTSVLEHEPRWRTLLDHNFQWLRPRGVLLLSWGAEGNRHHAPEPWAPVPVGDVIEFLSGRLELIEGYWEKRWFTGDCEGCYNIVAFAKGPR